MDWAEFEQTYRGRNQLKGKKWLDLVDGLKAGVPVRINPDTYKATMKSARSQVSEAARKRGLKIHTLVRDPGTDNEELWVSRPPENGATP